MRIIAYTGFDSRYTPMSKETCEWVKNHFKGAVVSATRAGSKFQDKIEVLQPGDNIREILHLPSALKQIYLVNDRLADELKKRGFLRFKIQPTAAVSVDRSIGVASANKLLKNIRENINLCQNATAAVENLLDGAKASPPDFSEIQEYANQLSTNDTIQAVSAIVSLKENDHVYAHCVDVGVIFQQTYYAIIEKNRVPSAFTGKQQAMLGAFLHDIGKARVPKEIINSTRRFEPAGPEMQEIRKHTKYGAELLANAGMPDVIVNMAHYHHVKLDETMTSSYPKGVSQDKALFETRLLAIIDIYQALVSGRSYKKSWTPSAVIRYLDAIAGVEFDLDLWNSFRDVMGYYPIGSLVQLSDQSLAFVVNVPEKDLLTPQVAVVVEPDGQRPGENRLIDLTQEKSLSIQKEVDAVDVFQKNAFTAFSGLNIV